MGFFARAVFFFELDDLPAIVSHAIVPLLFMRGRGVNGHGIGGFGAWLVGWFFGLRRRDRAGGCVLLGHRSLGLRH